MVATLNVAELAWRNCDVVPRDRCTLSGPLAGMAARLRFGEGSPTAGFRHAVRFPAARFLWCTKTAAAVAATDQPAVR